MEHLADILFEIFWIVTGLTANIIALVLSFILFTFCYVTIKGMFKKDKGED